MAQYTDRETEMMYNILGRTGLNVSALSLGTVELGMDYGIRTEGRTNHPSPEEAVRIIKVATDKGINFFDTAPNYGESEKILGQAVGTRKDCIIATKISVPVSVDGDEKMNSVEEYVRRSIMLSMQNLRRNVLDIVQIHNATKEDISRGYLTSELIRAKEDGYVRFIGVSVYGEDAAMAAIEDGNFDVIQIAFSILDQRMSRSVLPAAKARNIGVINRSALLKGALTVRARSLPPELSALRDASEKIIDATGVSWDDLPVLALRFCISSDYTDTVLVGVSSRNELDRAVGSVIRGELRPEESNMLNEFGLNDETILNPFHWTVQ